jgi:hypothetical protein
MRCRHKHRRWPSEVNGLTCRPGRRQCVTGNTAARAESCEPRLLLSSAGGAHRAPSVSLIPAAIIIAPVDVINGTSGNDTITLKRNPDPTYVDWTVSGNPVTYQVAVNDPNGLTINGLGGNDVINLDYTAGNPLPNIIHFNGTFTVNGLTGATPFANTALEIGQSTVYFSYPTGPSPAALVAAALKAGFNGGTWNGSAASSNGAVTSTAAAGGPVGTFGVGYADSADGVVLGQPANTVEVRYTVMGDTNLDRVVNSTDAIQMSRNYLVAGRTNWDQGNFNYDTTINFADAQILQKNFNAVASGSVVAANTTATATVNVATPTATLDVLPADSAFRTRKGRWSHAFAPPNR